MSGGWAGPGSAPCGLVAAGALLLRPDEQVFATMLDGWRAWLSKPGTRNAVAEAEREYAAGGTVSGDDLRAEFGLTPR